jgi:hypothetical protein
MNKFNRGQSVAGLLPVNMIEPDDIELPLIHYNNKDYKQAIRNQKNIMFLMRLKGIVATRLRECPNICVVPLE